MLHSLKTKISLIFFIALLGVITLGVFLYTHQENEIKKDINRFVRGSLLNAYNTYTSKINIAQFEQEGFTQLKDQIILKRLSKKEHEYDFYPLGGNHQGKIKMRPSMKYAIINHNHSYYVMIKGKNQPELVFIIHEQDDTWWIIVGVSLMSILLITLFIITIKSVSPLGKLRDKIRLFANGDDSIDCLMNGKDEISEVANEFHHMVQKIVSLRASRRLFLRNILHEFKTPITKGKLSTEMLPDSTYKETLQKLFKRQESLLEEFSRIESLGSGELKLNTNLYYVEDLIDGAFDLLQDYGNKIDTKNIHGKIVVDFDLFSIVLKNFIDNALKYSKDHCADIYMIDRYLYIRNHGKKLEYSLQEYKEPFFLQTKKSQESRGLGFGLFISLHICELHDIDVEYRHEDDFSYIVLNLQSAWAYDTSL